MEIFPYLFSVLLAVLVIYWSGANAARKPGSKLTGLFRYYDTIAPSAPARRPGHARPPCATSRSC
jgi:hypothetical protein